MNRTIDMDIARLIGLDDYIAARDQLRALGSTLDDADLARLTALETMIAKVQATGSRNGVTTFEFTYDVTLVATVRVKATSQREALKLIREAIDGNEANLGAWPNGDPIVSTIGIEGDADIVAIDNHLL